MTVLRKAPAKDTLTSNLLEFVLSDATIDRMGDTINPHGWDLAEFRRNPICLLNHSPDQPIGTWENVGVINNQLRGHLKLAPEGTSPRIDEIIKLVNARVLRSVSVGFVPIEYKPRANGKGIDYQRQRMLETSLVSIPANASATLIEARKVEARALGIASSSIDKIFRQSTNASGSERLATARRAVEVERLRAEGRARKAARNAKEDAIRDRMNSALTTLENLIELEKRVRPTVYDGFPEHDRHVKVLRQIKTWRVIVDSLAQRI